MSNLVERYIEYVQGVMEKYSSNIDLIDDESVTPERLNYVLAQYMPSNSALISEYQRVKIEKANADMEYQQWYDNKFVETRKKLNEESKSSSKIALKEIETELRNTYKDEYYNWQEKLIELEHKEAFMRRLLEQYKKFDQILTTLSNNMRSELSNLSLDNRINSNPKRNKVRKST